METGHSLQQAMEIDPPENGKGGGKLDDRLWREFPITGGKLKLTMAASAGIAKNGSEGRTIFAG
jgi:hypothetical protein